MAGLPGFPNPAPPEGAAVVIGVGPLEGLRGTVLGVDEVELTTIVAVPLKTGLVAVELDSRFLQIDPCVLFAPNARMH